MVSAVDEYLDSHWNLDQVVAWAETRDPDIVRIAALAKLGAPQNSTAQIAEFAGRAPTRVLQGWRDIDAELWNASGWMPSNRQYLPPSDVVKTAERREGPTFQLIFHPEVRVRWPLDPAAEALGRAWLKARHRDQTILAAMIAVRAHNDLPSVSAGQLDVLSPEIRRLASEFFSRRPVHGPPHVFVRDPFPTVEYLESLFRRKQLVAFGSVPNDPVAREITAADWAGLQIAVGDEFHRLGVWRIDSIALTGQGEFENVSVERDAVIKEFPIESPAVGTSEAGSPTDEDVRALIREEMAKNDGFVSQQKGAAIVRSVFPGFRKTRAMEITKGLTGNTKSGPKGPRKKSSG